MYNMYGKNWRVSKAFVLLILALIITTSSVLIYFQALNLMQPTETYTTTPTVTPTITPPWSDVTLSGAGASFLAPQMIEWSRILAESKGLKVEYQSVGSGAGRDMFFNKVVHFAGSDPPLTKEQYMRYVGKVMQLPIVVGSIAIIYNVPELPSDRSICLSSDLIALIYKGEVTYWDDQRILDLNPGLSGILPHREIVAVHRSDSSGTTAVFTTYLNKASPGIWTSNLVGFTIDWPVDATGRGIGGKGNEGVTQAVKTTPYSLGYVELSYAITQGLPTAAIRNSEGMCVKPTNQTILNAVRNSALLLPQSPLDDWSDVLARMLNPPGKDSYPIVSFSYIFIYRAYPDKNVVEALREFIKWINTEGQERMVPGYLPIPKEVREINLKAVDLLEVGES
ncbi:MAG: phosphate ABC transporter substrate-binding protein PstS [Sulfolobales archaeon]|nr:phosphate ABC transporter substrate-binding protein PstS [Sulfolobales archaeon]MCX8198936.1 phosphate ABC transporter substrate-binding protein PstS [Sulfolobales archaeon]MDW8169914.1 phosphate ABC transporter substrate-binding protein PstS [Desulfurococcaceae archaeon]